MTSSPIRTILAVVGLSLVFLTACRSEAVRELLDNYTPHERYQRRLTTAGLDQTALGREWVAVAQSSLRQPVAVEAPHREQSYLDARQATARAYRIALRRGQRLLVAFDGAVDEADRVFLDLFRAPRDPEDLPRPVMSADSLEHSIEYLVRRDGDYLIRIQPELLLGGPYSITIEIEPSLRFPVAGRDTTAIRSWYGDPRDGGRREHQGLDIFAPRGTPVVAAATGYIRSTRPNNLGGNVIWLRDAFDRTHYYAHLESIAVFRGQRVAAGDTIGFVGNSGNARTTPPHLHFGVYARGSFDPYPALSESPLRPQEFTGDPDLIGQLARTDRERIRVRALPAGTAPVVAELDRHTPMWVEAGAGAWYRVTLPNRATGYVAAALTEPLDGPIRRHRPLAMSDLLIAPDPASAAIDYVPADRDVDVLGEYDGFALAHGAAGRIGWVRLD